MGNDHDANADSALAFTTATAEATGKSLRTIQVETRRGEALGEDVLARVAEFPQLKTRSDEEPV
jgi:hypothetical protein